jgi:AraC family transcriptional regulator
VSVLGARFQGGAHFSATATQHVIVFHLSATTELECRVADRALRHVVSAGSLAIVPAGIDCAADATQDIDTLFIAVRPEQLALAAAEDSLLDAQLNARLAGHDPVLFDCARALFSESADNVPKDPLLWNETAFRFIARLVSHHTSPTQSRSRGALGHRVLARIREYIDAHLDGSIEVTALAQIAGRSPFHFSRIFARSVGITPHRYVVHLRLHRAIHLIREGRLGLAEIAACTGFADQSHMSRWARRVHGVPLTRLVQAAAEPRRQAS